jgi:DNA-binding transcriptional LysR family regulator
MRASPDDILGMTFFARVVEARSFSDAARSLGVSKSAVSARVRRLEERLGVTLLHRTTRRLALTADGVRLYELCARVVAEADEAAEVAAGASVIPRGTLRLHAPAFFVHLAKPIAEFMRLHPSMRIDLRLSDRAPERMVEDADLAIVIASGLTDSALTVRKLASIQFAVCAAPVYLRRKGIPFRPQELVHHDCLSHALGELAFQTEEGAVSMTSLSRLVVDDARFLRDAALAGFGIVMLPDLLVQDDVAAGRLHRVLDDFQSIELSVHALHPHGRLAPASVRAFLDHLAAHFRDAPWALPRAAVSPKAPVSKGPRIPMTEQDVRRLTAVVALYADVDAEYTERLLGAVARAKTMPAAKIPRGAVTMNSRIRLREGDREREVSLVYPWDASKDRISVLSALGLDLLGASVGGRIGAIPYQPEAAGDHHL